METGHASNHNLAQLFNGKPQATVPQQPANAVACGLPLNDFLCLQVNQCFAIETSKINPSGTASYRREVQFSAENFS